MGPLHNEEQGIMSNRDEILAAYESLSYILLAEEFKRLQAEKKEIKALAAALEQRFDILTKEVIPDKMAEDGFQTVSLKDGGRIQLSAQAYCSTKAGMRNRLFQWLLDHDFEDLITEVVNPGTLKAFIKEQTALGNDVPDEEIVSYDPYLRASVVKN